MSISTGVYRLAQTIKWGGRLLAGLLIFLMSVQIINTNKGSPGDWFYVIGAALILGITYAISWVLEGFAKS